MRSDLWDESRRNLRCRIDLRRIERALERDPARFSSVATFYVTIGHVKSGGTLLGAMIDSHPRAVVADSFDIFRYLDNGFGRRQLAWAIDEVSSGQARSGRVTGRGIGEYSVALPGQGKVTDARVVGVSAAGPTVRRLGAWTTVQDRLIERVAPSQLRLIHVIRHPLGPISAMRVRSGRTADAAIDDYFERCERLAAIRRQAVVPLLEIRYEDLTQAPEQTVRSVTGFLGLDSPPDFLNRCSRLIDIDRPSEASLVDWRADHLERMAVLAGRYPFLAGYCFEGVVTA